MVHFCELFKRFLFYVPQMSRNSPTKAPSLSGFGDFKKHRIHYPSQPVHVALQHVAVHIQHRGNVAMAEPCLDILCVTAALTTVSSGSPWNSFNGAFNCCGV